MGDGSSASGRFVWHDLMSTDPETSRNYYNQLLGWTSEPREKESGSAYQYIVSAGKRIGGIARLDESHQLQSHWMSYLAVESVDAVAHSMPDLGGRVGLPPTDLPGIGRFAICSDPTGARFSPFTGNMNSVGREDAPVPGGFCWTELLTTDTGAAAAFYREICDWSTRDVELSETDRYTIFRRGNIDAAGMLQIPADSPSKSNWLVYVAVEDVDDCALVAGKLGGKVLVRPTDVPAVGRLSVIADTVGATLAVVELLVEAA
jgi:predicted enzyme related to lactoylglutathione lyase